MVAPLLLLLGTLGRLLSPPYKSLTSLCLCLHFSKGRHSQALRLYLTHLHPPVQKTRVTLFNILLQCCHSQQMFSLPCSFFVSFGASYAIIPNTSRHYNALRTFRKFIRKNLGLLYRPSRVQNVLVLLVESGIIYMGLQVSIQTVLLGLRYWFRAKIANLVIPLLPTSTLGSSIDLIGTAYGEIYLGILVGRGSTCIQCWFSLLSPTNKNFSSP